MSMRVPLVMIGGLAALAAAAAAAHAQAPSDPLPDDPAKTVIMNACTTCHDVGLITVKPRAPEEWDALVGKMIDRGAVLTPDEKQQVTAYLIKNLGVPADAAPAPAPPPAPGL
jgi:hypothetical protein